MGMPIILVNSPDTDCCQGSVAINDEASEEAMVRYLATIADLNLTDCGIYYINLTDPLSVSHELRSNGVRVPEDMSVAGHDGSDVAASIKLTTMAQPAREIGRIAHNHPDRADARRYDAANRSRIAIGWPADGKGRRTGLQPIE